MSAGYELTAVRPGAEDYRAVPSGVRPIMEFIFADGFPHSIKDVRFVTVILYFVDFTAKRFPYYSVGNRGNIIVTFVDYWARLLQRCVLFATRATEVRFLRCK
jgi:hypothetical protein